MDTSCAWVTVMKPNAIGTEKMEQQSFTPVGGFKHGNCSADEVGL